MRSQSVAPLTEVFPVGFSFMPLRPPCGNDPTLSLRNIGVDNRDLDAIYDANRIHPDLAVVKAIIHSLKCRAFEDPDGVVECNTVKGDILRFFLGSQVCSIAPYLHYVFTPLESQGPAKGGQAYFDSGACNP
ncbi:hypothetical protein SBA4_820021 [Candidatus Sulfopaludibacter sp. SbA4]|nr:hypothetical protein SBA4_820021 [Candidatus Sulfopaludibacter sp. SbA4]